MYITDNCVNIILTICTLLAVTGVLSYTVIVWKDFKGMSTWIKRTYWREK